MAITDIIEEESLTAGAPSIKYTGDMTKDQGIGSMASRDPLLEDEYKKYIIEMEEQDLEPMSFEEFEAQARAGMANGGITPQLVRRNQDGSRPGYGGRVAFGGGGSYGFSDRGYQGGGRDKSGAVSGSAPGAGSPHRSNTPSGADDRSSALQTYNTKKATGRLGRQDANQMDSTIFYGPGGETIDIGYQGPLNERETRGKEFVEKVPEYPEWTPAWAKAAANFNNTPNRKFFFEKVIRGGKIPGLNYDEDELEQAYQDYMDNRMAGKTDAYGNPTQGFSYDDGALTGNFINDRDDGAAQNNTNDPNNGGGGGSDDDDEDDWYMPLAFRAEGGRVGRAFGGIMGDDGRRAYGLGSIFKKIKKVFKSPLGKAALLGLGGYKMGLFGGGKNFKLTEMIMGKGGKGGLWNWAKDNPFAAITGTSAISGLMAAKDYKKYDNWNNEDDGTGLGDLDKWRNYYMQPLSQRADGGRVGAQEGGLMDMGGMEKDYREDGGFVPIGGKEKADDVPARLSKNEFVMTADAVRGAGDGNIDKGSEVMYNIMKNLEAGGGVSEETQGLDGAREMFQTSQRLEEVL